MSPSVGNFVHDLVEMAKAMETLPQVQAELDRMREEAVKDGDRIARLEKRLMDRALQIDDLNAKIRSLEVERDDASFRELEAQDKVASVLREIGDMQAVLRRIEVTIVPPKPEPVPEPVLAAEWQPVTEDWARSGQGESSFTPIPTEVSTITESSFAQDSMAVNTPPASSEVVGESVSSPTGEPQAGLPEPTQESEPKLETGWPDGIMSRPIDQPYLGKNYIDVPRYVSYTDWVAGGGTYEGYWHGRGGFQAITGS